MSRVFRQFGSGSAEVNAARSFTRSAIDEWGLENEDAILIVSELAANALRHSSGGFGLSITHADQTMLIEVTDQGGGTPSMRQPSDSETTGRGLLIVDRLSQRWGSHPMGDHTKVVWAQLEALPL